MLMSKNVSNDVSKDSPIASGRRIRLGDLILSFTLKVGRYNAVQDGGLTNVAPLGLAEDVKMTSWGRSRTPLPSPFL